MFDNLKSKKFNFNMQLINVSLIFSTIAVLNVIYSDW